MLSVPLDGGPSYAETRAWGLVVEPFNAASALLYVVVGVYWCVRLCRRRPSHWLLPLTVPILTLGGVGGTLYHALRNWRGFLIMDYAAIAILALAASGTFAQRLLGAWWRVFGILAILVGAQQAMVAAARAGTLGLSLVTALNLSYLLVALSIAVPVSIYTLREAPRLRGRLAVVLCLYAVGLSFRALDLRSASYSAVGTHWLWHLLGAVATALLLGLIESLLDGSDGTGPARAARARAASGGRV